MTEIDELYLAREIEKFCKRARSDLEIFVSLAGEKDARNYEKIDYDVLLSHYRGLVETLTLIRIYEENFDRVRFNYRRADLEDYVSNAKEILIDLLISRR